MKKLKIWITICVALSALVILTLMLLLAYPHLAFHRALNEIKPESENIPAYVVDGVLYVNNNEVRISQIIRKISKENDFEDVLCVDEDLAYFVYSTYRGKHTWHVCTINLETLEIKEVFIIPGAQKTYRADYVSDYEERPGYYHDGKIVLNDKNMVYEYALSSGDLKIYSVNVYDFPERKIYGEFVDNWTIAVTTNSQRKIYTLEEMAEESASIAQIYTFKDRKIWNKSPALHCFHANSPVQFDGDTLYALCAVSSYSGTSYATILEYISDTDTWVYVATKGSGFQAGAFEIVPHVRPLAGG